MRLARPIQSHTWWRRYVVGWGGILGGGVYRGLLWADAGWGGDDPEPVVHPAWPQPGQQRHLRAKRVDGELPTPGPTHAVTEPISKLSSSVDRHDRYLIRPNYRPCPHTPPPHSILYFPLSLRTWQSFSWLFTLFSLLSPTWRSFGTSVREQIYVSAPGAY